MYKGPTRVGLPSAVQDAGEEAVLFEPLPKNTIRQPKTMPEPLIPTFDPIAMTAELKARLIGLPCVSEALPGVGGVIKTEPEHFEVEEILPYSACGEGEHVFIKSPII